MGTSPAIDLRTVAWIGEWCSYNFAAGSFHTKKLCSRVFFERIEFYWHKQRYRVFVPPFQGLRGNVHGSCMARWKARGPLRISANWTFFASYHGWGARHWSKSLCSKRGRSLNANLRGYGDRPRTTVGIRKWRCLHDLMFSRFHTVPACDRRTDRRTHDDD